MTPIVSVVVPIRNGEQTIGRCLDSLLAQDYPKDRYEVIVVDNDSTDLTAQIIKGYPVHAVQETAAHSAAAARNRGVREARGDVVAFIDGDCVAVSRWLSIGVTGFTHRGIGCVAGDLHGQEHLTLAQRYVEERGASSPRWALLEAPRPFAQTSNAFYRRAVLQRLGGFDAALTIGEDADLSWRMQDQLGLTIEFCPEAVVFHCYERTVWGLLRQRREYGYGWVALYAKYRGRMPSWTLRHTYRNALALGRHLGRWLRICTHSLAGWVRGQPDWEPAALATLDVGTYLAWKAGQLQASIRHRVWHV